MDTLCSQAFGAGKIEKLGIYLQSGIIVLGCSLLPVMILNWNTESFLLMFDQDPEVASLAGEFSRRTMIGLPFLFAYELFKKLLQAQNIVWPMAFIALIGIVVNVVTGYVSAAILANLLFSNNSPLLLDII